MIRVGVVCNGQTIEFNAENMKAIAEAATVLGVSFEALKEEIQRLVQSNQVACSIDRLAEVAELTELKIEALNYEFISLRKERVYCSYKPNLHKPDKRRCFRPNVYWHRTRSNPR